MRYLERTEEEKVRLATEMCEYLNDLIKVDPAALHILCETRVPCTFELTQHPTVQVVADQENPGTPVVVGLLGLLNGFIGVHADSWGYIAGVYGDDGILQCFDLADKFARTSR